MAPVNFSLVCFRLNRGGSTEEQLTAQNKKLIDAINSTGKTLLTQTTLKGKYTIRVSIGQRTTRESDVKNVWELIKSKAEEIL